MPRVLPAPFLLLFAACADDPPPPVVTPPPVAQIVRPDEGHLVEVRQLTSSGDNGNPRWSTDGNQIVLQTWPARARCPRVERVTLADPPEHVSIADGEDPAFLPGDRDVVYAAAPSCPRAGSAGEIAIDPGYDVFRAKPDGGDPRKLTDSPGYDAEPSVCAKNGTIVFTSMRDGDLDLYRMDADGGHVERITSIPGYDGAAVFDADCSHVAWHAWHPKGKELDEYTKQLASHVLKPPRLELWIANADGTDARQVTYFDARSSSPSWYHADKRLLFASTVGGESARDVDLWAVDVDGTNLERVSTAPGPDRAPAFSPDGKFVAFSSERGTPLGKSETNVFVARWAPVSRHVEERGADHLMGDCAWLADGAREGRGLGSKGLEDAGAYIERSFESFGLTPVDASGFRQPFDVTTRVTAAVTLEVGGMSVAAEGVRALGFSASTQVDGPLVFVGSDGDYAHIDVKGRIVVVRGGVPLRHAAWLAREHKAVGFIAIAEGAIPEIAPQSDEGIAAAVASNAAMSTVLGGLVRGQHPLARLAVTLAPEAAPAFNVVARWPASAPEAQRLAGAIVVAAHYDGIGQGSPGADDNASGTAALLQVARSLGEQKPPTRRDIVLVAFSGEEMDAAGAAAFVHHPPGGLSAKDLVAMIDLEMVGRLRDDTLQVFGVDSASEWPDLLKGACEAAYVDCAAATGGGVGGEDRRPFFDAGIPALHLFTGVHADLHQATDTVDRLNAAGMAQVARIAERLATDASDLGGRLTFRRDATAPIEGDARGFDASLGTIPDHAPPPNGEKGMLLAGVRPGGPADKAGLRRGDVLVRLGGHVIGGIDDVKFVLTPLKPGARVEAVVERDGKELTAEVTLDAPARR